MVNFKMRSLIVPMGLLVILMNLWGCAAYSRPKLAAESSRKLTKEDVVNMVTSDIGDEVIIAQIDATGSRFELSVSDVVELKNAGVSEKVIEYMISTGKEQDREGREARYLWYYDYPYHYYSGVRVVYLNGSRWHYYPRRGGRAGFWIRVRR